MLPTSSLVYTPNSVAGEVGAGMRARNLPWLALTDSCRGFNTRVGAGSATLRIGTLLDPGLSVERHGVRLRDGTAAGLVRTMWLVEVIITC